MSDGYACADIHTGADHGSHVSSTHIIEFNEFVNQPGDPSQLPAEPTVDLYAKLTTRDDFHWAFDFTNVTTTYYVVCQLRMSLSIHSSSIIVT